MYDLPFQRAKYVLLSYVSYISKVKIHLYEIQLEFGNTDILTC